jgi:hypothetical protein
MGTRCLTVLTDEKGNEIVVMYRQFDGYPEGHGKELAEFLSGIKMVNGISDRSQKIANGMGCLAAMIVGHFKTEPGGIYLHTSGTRDKWEDYVYFVTGEEGHEPTIRVDCGEYGAYDGPASGFIVFLKELEELDE